MIPWKTVRCSKWKFIKGSSRHHVERMLTENKSTHCPMKDVAVIFDKSFSK